MTRSQNMSDSGSRAEMPKQPQQPESSYVVSPVPTKMATPALPEDTDAALIERFVSGNEQFHISTDHPAWLYCKDGDGNSTSLRGDWFAASLRQFINPGATK